MPADPATCFARLAETISRDPRVDDPSVARGKGFGSKGLKIERKLFAFLSSKAMLVVKLPKERVETLAKAGKGEPFDPGHGRKMKEWLAVDFERNSSWLRLVREALEHAAR